MKRRYETKLGHNAHRQQYQHLKLKLKREHFGGKGFTVKLELPSEGNLCALWRVF